MIKTWWNYLPINALAVLLPFLAGALPTVFFQAGEMGMKRDMYLGGGPIRQWFINKAATSLDPEVGNVLIDRFMSSSAIGEYILYLPIALNVSAFLLLFTYCLSGLSMNINNFIRNSIYQSQRRKAKGE